MRGHRNYVWRYGAGKCEQHFKVVDVLGTVNNDYNEQMWTWLSGQYHHYIINKVSLLMYNFNVANRYQQDMNTPLSYTDTAVSLKTNYPFANGKQPYAYSRTAGPEGFTVQVFRSNDDGDSGLTTIDKIVYKTIRIFPRGHPNRYGRRAIKYNYYPRCHKNIELSTNNLPSSTVTIAMCLAKMQPRADNYFRVGIGFQPFVNPNLKAETSTEAYEMEVTFDAVVACKLTLLDASVVDFTN